MVKGLIGKKIGMSQVFDAEKQVMPVTVIMIEPCTVVQKKTMKTDGYESVQIGSIAVKPNKVTKPMAGHFKKSKVAPLKKLKEFKADDHAAINVGDTFSVDMFKVGDKVDVSGVSIGKGFAGVIKRHGFSGGKATHGSRFHRLPGSIGANSDPARTFKGRKLPGQMGNKNVTVQSLQVIDVRPEKNLMMVKGSVPGHKNSILLVKRAAKVNK